MIAAGAKIIADGHKRDLGCELVCLIGVAQDQHYAQPVL
jgi:hypothetical protein